ARDDPVDDLDRPRAVESAAQEPFELSRFLQFPHDALDYVVARQRAGELFRQRPRKRPIEDASDFRRREDVLDGPLEGAAQRAGRRARRVARRAAESLASPGPTGRHKQTMAPHAGSGNDTRSTAAGK